MSEFNFTNLPLKAELLKNLESLGFESMTAIQAKSLPLILENADVIAQGQTGSGKTAAFGLGLLNKLEVSQFSIQSLVLCPTRELADQVSVEIRRLARSIANVKVLTLSGGVPLKAQAASLEKGVHIVVGTPGRIEDLLNKRLMQFDQLNTLVLDEADRMLDMGFEKTLAAIGELLPKQRQTMLFSAIFPRQIEEMAKGVCHNATHVKVAPTQDGVRIDSAFYEVKNDKHRLDALKLLLMEQSASQVVVFCNTRQDTQSIAGGLKSAGFSAAALHGDMEQKDRDQTLIRFSNNSLNILVATDVAARGLDIKSLDLVINCYLPREMEVYTHRIGRTGRAGAKGIAFSLFDAGEKFRVEKLEKYLEKPVVIKELPIEQLLENTPTRPSMSTLRVEGGKKQKLRPGDIVGALTKGEGVAGDQVGKIQVMDNWTYIAVERAIAKLALNKLSNGKIKGKSFRARLI